MNPFDTFHALLLWFYMLPGVLLLLLGILDWRQRGKILPIEFAIVLVISLVPVFNLAAVGTVVFELLRAYRRIRLWRKSR